MSEPALTAPSRSLPEQVGASLRAPLSAAQQREWFLHMWRPTEPFGNLAAALRLHGPLQVDLLRAALTAVASRHAALRTSFGSDAGVPFQVVCPAGPVLAMAEVPGETAAERERAARQAVEAESAVPFDLGAGIPVRVRLVRLAAADHVLLLTAHRLVADQGSLEIVLAELAETYSAAVQGRLAQLDEVPVQLPDVVAVDRDRHRAGELEGALRYWQHQLAALPMMDLPADRSRPQLPTARSGVAETELAGPVLARLAELAGHRAAPLRTVLIAATAALLARYTRHDEVVLGTYLPSGSGRAAAGLAGVVAPLAAPSVLRLDVSTDPTFAELLEQAVRSVSEAEPHLHVPFASIVRRFSPAREPGRHPLFTVLVDHLDGAPPTSLAGLRVERWLPPGRRQLRDLHISLVSAELGTGAAARLRVEYSLDLFDRSRIDRLLGHLSRLLGAAAAAPGTRLSRLALLGQDERAGLLRYGQGPARDYGDDPVHVLVSRQAERTPDAVALVAPGVQLSYAELDQRAGRLADRLRQLGAGPGELVGVLCERQASLLVALLAALKTGAGYVPLDRSYPAERLAVIAQDAGLAVLVTQRSLLDRLPAGLAGPTVCLSPDGLEEPAGIRAAAGVCRDPVLPRPDQALDGVCHVVFTSGSTGRPKGVATSHRNVVNYLDGLLAIIPPDRFRRVLLATSVSFDACLVELWPPLVTGGTLVVVENLLLVSAADIDGVTLINSVPSVLAEYLRIAPIPNTVRTVALGAEPLPPALVAELFRHLGPGQRSEVYNMYGPTETTAYATMDRVSPDEPVTIGRPMSNVRAYVLDRFGGLAPFGVAGELVIGGPGVALGYLNRPDLTAERFVPDPFGPELPRPHPRADAGAGRVYRSGDLSRWHADGRLEFLGRIDTQVKVRGFRIELGEVETALRGHPGVAAAVVAVKLDHAGDKHLVGYIVPAGPTAPTADELADQVRRTLPGYMVPAAFMVVPAIPLSPNGKVSRAALPAPPWGQPSGERGSRPQSGPVQEAVASLWVRLLPRERAAAQRLGADDDFFALGGSSALALRLVAQLRRRLGVRLPVGAVFQDPTLGGLSRAVENALLDEVEPAELARLLGEVAHPEESGHG